MPATARLTDVEELRVRSVRVADREEATEIVRDQGVGGVPEWGGDTAGLVEDDQDVPRVNPLEGRGVHVRGFHTEGHDLFVARRHGHVPLGLVAATGQIGLGLDASDLSPENDADLSTGGCTTDYEGVTRFMRTKPPRCNARCNEALSDFVAGVDSGTSVITNGLRDLALLRPNELVAAIVDPRTRVALMDLIFEAPLQIRQLFWGEIF